MAYMITLNTKRLILRPWKEEDLEPFAQLNADPRVMEYFPAVMSRKESNDLALRIRSRMQEQGWGLWAVSVPGVADFIGFIGLNIPLFDAPFMPATEIGWRLAFPYWGKGYATEGAIASLQYGFETLQLPEIVAFTTIQNMRSRRIMQKIGMQHDPQGDFEHPKVAEGSPLKKHVLYRISQEQWKKTHIL